MEDRNEAPERHTIWLPKSMHKEIRRIAYREERSISDVARELIEAGLAQRKQEKTS